jgi:ribA/ribD-fused uncharacterized protein
LRYDGWIWPTSEHAYQAAKTLNEEDKERIASQSTPALAKRMGKSVAKRPDWEQVKLKIMYDIVLAKFQQNPVLKYLLILTKDAELIEGNTWGDTYWGVCNGKGENHLGKILMRIRDELN